MNSKTPSVAIVIIIALQATTLTALWERTSAPKDLITSISAIGGQIKTDSLNLKIKSAVSPSITNHSKQGYWR